MRLCQLLRKCCGSSILPYEFLSPAQRWASTGKNVAHSVRLKTQTTGKMKHPMKQPTVSRDGQVLEKMYLSTVSVFPNKPSISISIKEPSTGLFTNTDPTLTPCQKLIFNHNFFFTVAHHCNWPCESQEHV